MPSVYLHQVQPCVMCGGQTRRDRGEIVYDFGQFTIRITSAPVAICEECGEQYVPGEAGVILGDVIADIAERFRAFIEEQESQGVTLQTDMVVTSPPYNWALA